MRVSHSQNPPPPEMILLFVVLFLTIPVLLATFGGWSRLAKLYRATGSPDVALKLTSGRIGVVNYNNCLRVGFSHEGIHLRMLFLFRLFHPPLFIPWSGVRSHTHRTILRFWNYDQLEIEADPPVKVGLRMAVPAEFLGFIGGRGANPPAPPSMVQMS